MFTVNEIYIISRSGDSPFTIKHSIPLLGRKDAPAPAPAPRAATPPAPTMAAIIKRDIPAEKSDPVRLPIIISSSYLSVWSQIQRTSVLKGLLNGLIDFFELTL